MQISRIGSAPAEDSGGGRRTEASGRGNTEGWCQQHATLGRLLGMEEEG